MIIKDNVSMLQNTKGKRFIIPGQWQELDIFVATDTSIRDNTFCLTFWRISLSEEWFFRFSSGDERGQGPAWMLVASGRLSSRLARFPPERLMDRKSLSPPPPHPHLASFPLGKSWVVSCHLVLSFEDYSSAYFSFYTEPQSVVLRQICLKTHKSALRPTCWSSRCILQTSIHNPGVNYAIKNNIGKPWSIPELLQVNWCHKEDLLEFSEWALSNGL